MSGQNLVIHICFFLITFSYYIQPLICILYIVHTIYIKPFIFSYYYNITMLTVVISNVIISSMQLIFKVFICVVCVCTCLCVSVHLFMVQVRRLEVWCSAQHFVLKQDLFGHLSLYCILQASLPKASGIFACLCLPSHPTSIGVTGLYQHIWLLHRSSYLDLGHGAAQGSHVFSLDSFSIVVVLQV